ncbi:MAG: IS630 transposase-related protein [Dolichospermum sp.]
MAYSLDLREKALLFSKQASLVETARIFQIGLATLKRWLKRPELKASKSGPKAPSKLSNALLEHALEQNPDATLAEHAQTLGVSITSVFYACKRNKITRKKNHALPRAK